MAHSLEKEYKKALKKKAEAVRALDKLPTGYISEKLIYGTKQYYLQKRVGKRVISKHISISELSDVRRELALRETIQNELSVLDEKLGGIEAAAKLVSHDLYKRILFINACAPMEDLSFEEKMRASDFAQTMNAIEGIPTTEETKQGISAWYLGEIDFLSLYEATLRKYGFPVEVR